MFSKLLLTLAITVLLVLPVVFRLANSSQTREFPILSDREQPNRTKLTEPEERDLAKFVPLALEWTAVWTQPTHCPAGDTVQKLDFAEVYKRHEGQEIEMGVEIYERSLVVSLDALHTSLRFARLYEYGLSPAEGNLFCENSYKESKAEVTRLQEENHLRYEEERLRNTQATEVMNRIRAMHPPPPDDRVVGEQSRRYLVPQLSKSRELQPAWSDEKKTLYEQVVEVIRQQAKLGCRPGQTVGAALPDFSVGEPAIYILMSGPFYGGGNYVEWIDFERDPSNGKYTAQHAKSFGLPDEIPSLASLIRRREVKQLRLKCSPE